MTPPEVARVLGLAGPDTPALLTAAQRHLERALTAEILINRDSQECAGPRRGPAGLDRHRDPGGS